MTNPTSNFGWQMPEPTDLVTNLPADFEVFGQAVDTDFADLLGGTTGQVLSKTSNTDLDFTWTAATAGDITGVTAGTGISGGGTSGTVTVTNDMATTITAAGDIVVGTGSGTYDNLPIGTTNQILTADTSVSPYKVKWATPAAAASGLTLIFEQSYSSATTINVDNCFSATYNNYHIMNTATMGSAATFTLRMRVSSTDTTTNYVNQLVVGDNTTVTGYKNPFGTDKVFFADASENGVCSYTFLNPYLTKETVYTGTAGYRDGSNLVNRFVYAAQTTNTSFTGFTLLAGQSATGKVSIYGYAI